MMNSLAQHSLTRIIAWQLCKSGSGLSLAIVHPLKHLRNSVQKSLKICFVFIILPHKPDFDCSESAHILAGRISFASLSIIKHRELNKCPALSPCFFEALEEIRLCISSQPASCAQFISASFPAAGKQTGKQTYLLARLCTQHASLLRRGCVC